MTFVLIIGWLTLAYIFYKIAYKLYLIIYPFVIAQPLDLKELGGANWTVVTGATDGIGKQYAFQLADRGFNIVLISRTQLRLDQTKQEILQKHPKVDVKTIVFDFTNANLEDYETVILKGLEGLDIGVLVNNVGMYYDYGNRFDKISTKHHRDLLVVNSLPIVVLTSAIVNQMVPRNKGIIINISSGASTHTMKLISVYSASKKFVTWLTTILSKEYADTGIIFQAVNAGMVSTKMSRGDVSLFCPTPENFVRQALRSVGHVTVTSGCIPHEIEIGFMFLPEFILDKATQQFHDEHRKKFLASKKD